MILGSTPVTRFTSAEIAGGAYDARIVVVIHHDRSGHLLLHDGKIAVVAGALDVARSPMAPAGMKAIKLSPVTERASAGRRRV